MQSFIDLLLKILPLAIKSKELLDAVTSILTFLRENEHLVELVMNWLDGMFGAKAEGEVVPADLEAIAAELETLKAAM